mmetsp:Transcript_10338/g.14984  ORF Transcript_10338/g.14984 Transcript_10338/m.14984 type:complete len:100 (-) Transcript_10338:286-585(-)|eukprot:CAMPEP_0175101282 /NCGR_PEP_ID=MMETSP0086_2-20121207/7690_1 /TAXON_ID=136419 /ORGANISM="Unknown Unknown, Strain D1" /LENGTH=99 /DNA_ID=CAMNT_0016375755 /DNA_START=36 /DNA_END=335 /DNA_ORIENTATION=-
MGLGLATLGVVLGMVVGMIRYPKFRAQVIALPVIVIGYIWRWWRQQTLNAPDRLAKRAFLTLPKDAQIKTPSKSVSPGKASPDKKSRETSQSPAKKKAA